MSDTTIWDSGVEGPPGPPGPAIELRTSATHIQWRVIGDVTWLNLVLLEDLRGPQGIGIQGDRGPQGLRGAPGLPGEDGEPGPSIELDVVEDSIVWRITGEELWIPLISLEELTGPEGPQGLQGEPGEDGEPGSTGPANVLTVGTVEAGEEAQVTITGESPEQEINFVLPRGEQGIQGEPGEPGLDGEDGAEGPEGPANILTIGNVTDGEEAEATITGASPAQVLNLVLPRGEAGEAGEDGSPGQDGSPVELRVTSTHIQWKLEDSSTWINLISLEDIEGPQGIQGVQGEAGQDGEDGLPIELSSTSTHLRWRVVGDSTWIDLIPLADITGPQGEQGEQGVPGENGEDGTDGTDGEDGRSVEMRVSGGELQYRLIGDSTWVTLTTWGEAATRGVVGGSGDLMAREFGGLGVTSWGSPPSGNLSQLPHSGLFIRGSATPDKPSNFGAIFATFTGTRLNFGVVEATEYNVPSSIPRKAIATKISVDELGPWAEFYTTANALAPVAQSGGVPTGGIIESNIFNAYEGYNILQSKYANGVMEYSGFGTIDLTVGNLEFDRSNTDQWFRSKEFIIEFPESFSSNFPLPAVQVALLTTHLSVGSQMQAKQVGDSPANYPERALFRIMAPTDDGVSATSYITFRAVGMWV